MMSIFGRWRHVWRSTIDTFVLETVHSIYYSGPLQNGGNHRRRYASCILSFFFNNRKIKYLCFRFIVPSRRRLHLESLPRGRDLRHKPGQWIVRLLLRHRLQGGRLLGGHRRVRAGWVIIFILSFNSWKILRLRLRKWSRNESLFFFLSLYDPLRSPGIVINDSLDSRTMISLVNEKNISKIVSHRFYRSVRTTL